MKVTVEIDDSRYEEFTRLVKTLDYATLSAQYVVPEWQQNMVRERFERIDRGEMELHEVDDVMKRVFGKE